MSLYDKIKSSEKSPAEAFKDFFSEHTVKNSCLSMVSLELTPLCNFKCAFCYARVSPEELKEKGIKVKGFEQWKRYIDEIAQMNCLELALTGGECTLHPDFCKIYEYAYDQGLVISVFTNGSNITDEIFELFKKKPPARIYITLYGNSPKVYEKVTGGAKYHDIVKANVEKLIANKFDVILQGTFCVDNVQDTEALFDYAFSLKTEFRYSNRLLTYGNCTHEVKKNIAAANSTIEQASKNIWLKKRGLSPEDKKIDNIDRRIIPKTDGKKFGIKCNGGKNNCFIRHDGMMAPCNTFDAFLVDTEGRTVKECFEEINSMVKSMPRIAECEGCIHYHHCVSCAAAHYNSTGKLGVPAPDLCFKILEPEKAKAEREFYDKHGYVKFDQ